MAKKTEKKPDSANAQEKKRKKRDARGAGSFEAQLRATINTVEIANALTSPLKRSIENLLRLAAQSVGSDEASVLVRDGNEGGLRFLVAIGEVADKLLTLRIPPGKGIAGFVFSSGQPMVVADVAQEETFYAEVDRAVGFSTQTILATPLRVEGEMVGVLEFVNREGDPPFKPFTPEEMDQAAHFADAIATLVDAHESAGLIETLFEHATKSPAGAQEEKVVGDAAQEEEEQENGGASLRRWLREMQAAPEHRDLLQMAVALRDVASRGDAERELCRDVLDALARFTEKRAAASTGYSATGYFGF